MSLMCEWRSDENARYIRCGTVIMSRKASKTCYLGMVEGERDLAKAFGKPYVAPTQGAGLNPASHTKYRSAWRKIDAVIQRASCMVIFASGV